MIADFDGATTGRRRFMGMDHLMVIGIQQLNIPAKQRMISDDNAVIAGNCAVFVTVKILPNL